MLCEGNFLRRLALPNQIKDWSLRTMREKLVKIGAKVVSHGRYVTFQMAVLLVSKSLFHACFCVNFQQSCLGKENS